MFDILCLREVGLQFNQLSRVLNIAASRRTWIADWDPQGKCGALIILGFNYHLLSIGSQGNGVCTWAILHSQCGTLNIASINKPPNINNRIVFWDWLRALIRCSRWFLTRDFTLGARGFHYEALDRGKVSRRLPRRTS